MISASFHLFVYQTGPKNVLTNHRTIPVERLSFRMADDKNGRDKQAQDAEKRQRKREMAAEIERGDEAEPPVEIDSLIDIELQLESLTFPATGADVVAAVGDRVVKSTTENYRVEELVPAVETETFESPVAVRKRVQRPTVAAAMKRVFEAATAVPNKELSGSQRDAYERTFEELKAIDADDDDRGIQVISDWIVERMSEKGKLPGSRDVRREAAKFCRKNGYQVRNDEWLGV